MNKAEICANHINSLLTGAGWNIHNTAQVGRKIPVAGRDIQPRNGFAGYCLYDASGDVPVVVETKKTNHNLRMGKEQLRQYTAENRSINNP